MPRRRGGSSAMLAAVSARTICSISSLIAASFYSSPNAMHIVVVLEDLEEFAGMLPLFVRQFWKTLGDVTELARDDRPAIRREPLRDCMQIAPLGDEARAGG